MPRGLHQTAEQKFVLRRIEEVLAEKRAEIHERLRTVRALELAKKLCLAGKLDPFVAAFQSGKSCVLPNPHPGVACSAGGTVCWATAKALPPGTVVARDIDAAAVGGPRS